MVRIFKVGNIKRFVGWDSSVRTGCVTEAEYGMHNVLKVTKNKNYLTSHTRGFWAHHAGSHLRLQLRLLRYG